MDFRISEWISGFQSGFLDFRLDFWISVWISADGVRDFFRDGPLEQKSACSRGHSTTVMPSHAEPARAYGTPYITKL